MIKFKISDFHSEWSQRISQLDFANIEEFEDKLTKVVADYDTSSLAEFEVLFLDNWVRLSHALSEKKSTLLAQENIRLEQIKLAEEREKQRLEAEKLQAEQKRVAEEQRIAQENFLREKREFEEKQDEAKFQERCKQLTDFGCEFEPKLNGYYKVGYFIHSDDVKSADSELWERELQDAKDAYKNDLLDANKIVGASFLSDEESAKEKWSKAITEKNYISDYPELDVDPKGVMQTQEVEFEENIYIGNYKNITETFASFELIFLIADLPKFENMTLKELLAPYNIPTRKTNE
jgi:hypothetical protein